MSTEPFQPFPPIPLELKGEILSFADTDTLAKACSVSLAFLQMAAPLLYRDITFIGPEGLEKFLTLRADVQVSELAPYLDLSLVQSVTYIDQPGQSFAPFRLYPTEVELEDLDEDEIAEAWIPHRLLLPGATGPPFTPLCIHTLHFQSWDPVTDFWTFFNPVKVLIERRPDSPTGCCSNLSLSRWTRLREMLFRDVATLEPLFDSTPTSRSSLIFEVSGDTEEEQAGTINCMLEDAHGPDLDQLSLIESIEIRVRAEGVKQYFLGRLQGSPLLARTTVLVKPAAQTTSSS